MKSVIEISIDYRLLKDAPQEVAQRVQGGLGYPVSAQPLFSDAVFVLRVTASQPAAHLVRDVQQVLGSAGRWNAQTILDGVEETPEAVLREVLPALERAGIYASDEDRSLLLNLAERVRSILSGS